MTTFEYSYFDSSPQFADLNIHHTTLRPASHQPETAFNHSIQARNLHWNVKELASDHPDPGSEYSGTCIRPSKTCIRPTKTCIRPSKTCIRLYEACIRPFRPECFDYNYFIHLNKKAGPLNKGVEPNCSHERVILSWTTFTKLVNPQKPKSLT